MPIRAGGVTPTQPSKAVPDGSMCLRHNISLLWFIGISDRRKGWRDIMQMQAATANIGAFGAAAPASLNRSSWHVADPIKAAHEHLQGEEDVQNPKNFANVINGCPLAQEPMKRGND